MKNLFITGLLSLSPFVCSCEPKEKEVPVPPPPSSEVKNWKLVFEENFDGTTEELLKEWYMYDGPGHDKNGLRSPEAFSIEDGLLVITARMKDDTTIVSGGIAHRQNYTYGKFEFRVRTEADPSKVTSGVVLTWPKSEKWPIDGENDIYETGTSDSRFPFYTFIHYGADNRQHHFIHEADGKEWQIMAMEWDEEAIKIYRNGRIVYKLIETVAIPKVPHHICLQLDAFKKEMTGTVKMYVDWVKIYQEEEEN